MNSWLYHKDEWAKPHPIFEGLPTGMLDYALYRQLIPDVAWAGQDRRPKRSAAPTTRRSTTRPA